MQQGISGRLRILRLRIIRGLVALKGQMDIFDFIEKPEEQSVEQSPNIPRQLLYKVKNPVLRCVNCVCQYCVNNEEEVWDKVRPDEVI